MNTNFFIKNPLRAVIFDPINLVNKQTICFLGDIPSGVANACKSCHAKHGKPSDHKLLREFYGSDYLAKLGLNVKDWSKAYIERESRVEVNDMIVGGDDIEALLSNDSAPQHSEPVNLTPDLHYDSHTHIYPEDKFSELKEKLQVATGIPTYRQHLFYMDKGRVKTLYRLYAQGLYNVNIKDLRTFADTILGTPVDKFLYDVRDDIHIEALDTFQILEDIIANPIVYIVDLAQFTTKITTQLVSMVKDTYQFELYYYGFIIKYWPQLTQECFHNYVLNEPELEYLYPDLAKNKQSLMAVQRAEQAVVDANYKNMTKALAYANNIGVTVAITQMVATVFSPKTSINIRNLFDKLHVSKCIPEIHAYIDHGNKKYLLRKRHSKNMTNIQFPAGTLMKTGIVIALSLKKSDQDSYHNRPVSTMENEQSRYLFFNIWPNGRYYVRTIWNEEDEFSFDEILKIMKRFTDPVINSVNSMGKYVFSMGNSLASISKQNINYQSLNVCIFWKRVIMESVFKEIKNQWEPYVKAKIISPRNLQQFDRTEFLFRKGMYEFDTSAIERIVTASNNIVLNNYYSHMSNSVIKQKWDQNYDGRVVRMVHRTTDIKFEIGDIRDQEFVIFYNYVVNYIYRIVTNDSIKSMFNAVRNYKNVRKLRKLREQDPELYNLKKYNSKKGYSRICQSKQQPLIYTNDEIKTMSNTEVKKLTEYWNFTLNKPAFYGCPNKTYPHLGFIIGVHPKGYCLPCCNKKSQVKGKKQARNQICLQKHKYSPGDEDVDTAFSRHIMKYGKDIDFGRLSRLPSTGVKELLYGSISPPADYFIYGVPQQTPGANNIGIIYSIAQAMGIPMETLVMDIIKRFKNGKVFNILLNGGLVDLFQTEDVFLASIKDVFIDAKIFNYELLKFTQWNELFIEMVYNLYGISVFMFIDNDGQGSQIDLYTSSAVMADISNGIAGSSQSYITLIKKSNSVYPIFIINIEDYVKTQQIAKRMYSSSDNLVQILAKVMSSGTQYEVVDDQIDMELVKGYTTAGGGKILCKYINGQNMCYAALVQMGPGVVYIPLKCGPYSADGIKIDFGVFSRKQHKVRLNDSVQVLEGLNNYIKSHHLLSAENHLYRYKLLDIANYIFVEKSLIGLNVNGAVWYVTEYVVLESHIPVLHSKFDYTEVNAAIAKRAGPKEDPRSLYLGKSLYENYIYQLFVLEFMNYFDNERNTPLREELIKLIADTDFKKNTGKFRESLHRILQNFPDDYISIQRRLVAFYYSRFNKLQLVQDINSTVYNFDRITYNKLSKLDKAEMVKALKHISKSFAVEQNLSIAKINFPNIYMPCAESQENPGYCKDSKLIINRPIDDFIDIFAADLRNDIKNKYLESSIWTDNIISYLKFDQHPNESISVYKLSE